MNPNPDQGGEVLPGSPSGGSVLLRVSGLEVGYRGQSLLPPLSFQLEHGEFWGLLGANGAGKTTMLRTILGRWPPLAGRVERGPGVRVAYVPQRGSLEDRLPGRVCDVVMDGLDRGWSFLWPFLRPSARRKVRECLQATGAWQWRSMPFTHLSEGQKQRVQVAAALASDPDLLVLDEPTASMDQAGERETFGLLDTLVRERGISVLVVSHHQDLVLDFATHLVLLDRAGGLAVAGSREEVLGRPEVRARLVGAGAGVGPIPEGS